MKKYKVLIIIAIIGMGILGTKMYNVNGSRRIHNKEIYEYAKDYSKKNLDDKEIYSNGVVSKKEIQKRVDNINENLGNDMTQNVDEIAEEKAGEQALYMYACDRKFEVSEEELNKLVEKVKKELKGTEEKEVVEDFIDGSGMSSDEYWDMVKERYRVTETINKCLRDYEKKEIERRNIDISDDDYNEEIIKIDEELKEIALKEYKIKIK